MRLLSSFLWFLGSAMTLRADTLVYVSMAPEQKIQVLRLDAKDGGLTPVEAIAVDGAPGSLAVGPHKKFLYASLRSTSTLASFRIDAATGKLTHISTVALPKDRNAAFVATDRAGRWLLSASYMGGTVVVHRLTDGIIEAPAVQTIETAKTAHCIAIDKDNRWLFVPHVAPNAVYQFQFDAATGKLTEQAKAPGGSPKAGPRHLAFHPSRPFAFTSDETGNSITSYSLTDLVKGITPLQTESTLPNDFQGKNTTAEVKVHPSGKYVWVSNRGHDSLAGFRVASTDGKLQSLGQTPTEKTPRSFDLSPDGRYLFAAGEGSGKLAVYRVAAETGALTRIGTHAIGKSLTWVMAVDLPPAP